ncbi:condensation domain-containing protein [Chryseolinea lacunae]|uniref:Condensation domain-containing protein n=1 Tax=Chryseolinea lacunae TaxID=2801331 RepID=A0ABS1KWI8_9BACT|nr:condensation domain-containing protein [Chryseolinea lacunae]MBL0743047.1 hypothetical protein [Chryseolinea lacunae]
MHAETNETMDVENDVRTALLENLKAINVSIRVKDGQLVISGAKENLTPELMHLLKANKAAMVTYFSERHTTPQTIQPIEDQEYYNTSNHQRVDWNFATKRGRGEDLFKMTIVKNVSVDIDVLKRVFIHIIKSHEALRTNFFTLDGELKLKIHDYDAQRYGVEVFDWRQQNDPGGAAKECIDKETARMIDLEKECLFKMQVHHVDDESCLIAVFAEHIVFDLASIDFLMNEFFEIYNAFVAWSDVPTTREQIQLKDFVAWKNDAMAHYDHKAYWEERHLDNSFEFDFNKLYARFSERHVEKLAHKHFHTFFVGEDLIAKLRVLAVQRHVSLFGLVTSTFIIFLSRIFEQRNVLTSILFMDRDRLELENMVGNCTEYIFLFNRIDPDNSVTDAVVGLCHNFLESTKFKYPWEADGSWPFCNKNIFKINYLATEASKQNHILDFTPRHVSQVSSPERMLANSYLEIKEYANGLSLECRSYQYYYAPGMIEALFEQYIKFLHATTRNPTTRIIDLLV